MKYNLYHELEEHMYLFNNGEHYQSYKFLGSKKSFENDRDGYRFTVWAPNALSVSVVGDFSGWDPLPMEKVGSTGAWSTFSSAAQEGQLYKYYVRESNGSWQYKIDPYAQAFETSPKDASIVCDLDTKKWKDGRWMANKKRRPVYEKPLNIYEVHPTSWKKHSDGSYYSIADLAASLIPYVKEMGYTHIEFMPLMDHPLEASWGYQITGYYALTGRFGNVADFREFVDYAHQNNIGVIMDWVPGHFCRNANTLAFYDGGPTFEYHNYERANNVRWGTLNFDLGKHQVQSFLISNAVYWLEEFHLDGLRVDAVSNMLYLDCDEGPWTPNEDGSNHNREGVAFLQKLNTVVFERNPEVLMIAEESTAWANVTKPVHHGGLGFNYKWNMGWMNDTLRFMSLDPYFRRDNFHLLTFSFMYAFNENFILPLSHDEVVHGKKSLLGKVPGDRYNQFANLRTLQAYAMAHPGKKLNFMGNELGQFLEWRYYEELEWDALKYEYNTEYQHFIKELNHLYLDQKALHQVDDSYNGLEIIDADNSSETVLSFIRKGNKARDFLIVICNFTPVERRHFQIGVPYEGIYEVLFNTERKEYGGTWTEEQPNLSTKAEPFKRMPYSIELTVPALGVLFLKPKRVFGVPK